MKTTIGITWIPRKREYFMKSIKTVDHDNVIIYPDGFEFKFPTRYEVRNLGENVGCFKHYYRVLTDLVENTDSDIVGVFADDIVYRKGWIDKATEKLHDESVGYVACYVPKGLAIRNDFKDGWNVINGGWDKIFGGGFLMRKEVAVKVLNHPFILDHLANYEKNEQIDLAVPQSMYEMGLTQLFPSPSLINHIGMRSTLNHKHHSWSKGVGWVLIPLMFLFGCEKHVKCVYCEKGSEIVKQCEDEVSGAGIEVVIPYWENQGYECVIDYEDRLW